jgi:hypothetical protein
VVAHETRMTRCADASTNEQATARITVEVVCYTDVMTEVRGRERSGLYSGEAADRTREAPMDMAMELAPAVTSIAADIGGTTTVEPIARNENRIRRWWSEAPPTPSDWSCPIREDEQRLGMRTLMQEREQKWDSRHEDNKVWGAGITNMIAKTMKGVVKGQEGREKAREMTARTDGRGL